MRMHTVAFVCAIAIMLACASLIAIGCARLRRVSPSEVVTKMPPTSIVPPIATVAPPASLVEAPPAEVPEVEVAEEKPAKPAVSEAKVITQVELRDEFKVLHGLLSELQDAVSKPSPERVEAISLRVLVRLAHIEVKALKHLHEANEAVRTGEVVQVMDEMRANLRDARSAVKRGSAKVASATISEMIDKANALEEMLTGAAQVKENISQPATKGLSEKH